MTHGAGEVVAGVSRRLAALRRRRAAGADAATACAEVEDLVVVCSSSRGGSSLFGELLRSSPDLLTFSAEINPHVTIPVLGHGPDLVADPTSACLDGEGRRILEAELALDLGQAAPIEGEEDVTALADHTAWRLTMQWPQEDIQPDAVAQWTRDALRALEQRGAWHLGLPAPREELLVELLPALTSAHPSVDAGRYDVRDMTPREDPEPAGPHAPVIVEMAPFVLPRSWRRATSQQRRTMPVVVTTPRNAFRLPLLRAIFPNARMRVLHLTRNPAAAVNGLRDGWLHHGFFTVDTGGSLEIAGYSDRHPDWASWWCYDLPPGWRACRGMSLEEVCAFQWQAAHRETLDQTAALSVERKQVHFEDIVGSHGSTEAALADVATWLDIDPAPLVAAGTAELPVVMSTEAPRPARWRRQESLLLPVVSSDDVIEQAVGLGYEPDPATWV